VVALLATSRKVVCSIHDGFIGIFHMTLTAALWPPGRLSF